jgi:hypothetical protein
MRIRFVVVSWCLGSGDSNFQEGGARALFVMVGSRLSTSVRYSCGLIPRRQQLIRMENMTALRQPEGGEGLVMMQGLRAARRV